MPLRVYGPDHPSPHRVPECPGAESEFEPAGAQQINARRLLGQHQRRAQGQIGDILERRESRLVCASTNDDRVIASMCLG